MNQEHFKTKLLEQKVKLEKEIERYLAEDPYRGNLRNTEVLDDAITEIEEHDRLLATSDQLKKDLREVDKALQRIESGSYGVCQSCGQRIEEERLNAVPWATMCLSCQKKSKR